MPSGSELPTPLGFPRCPKCAYLNTGAPQTCLECASKTIRDSAAVLCPTCSQSLDHPGAWCRNRLCNDPDRAIDSVHAIGVYSGDLSEQIRRYKYDNKWGWGGVFGRLVLGWLEVHASPDTYDLILANPTHTPLGSGRGHTEEVIHKAATEDQLRRFTFDTAMPATLTKTAETTRSAGGAWDAKQAAAIEHRQSLTLRQRIAPGARLLIYDDVCTSGNTLNEVAGFLKAHGARHVEGLVLARTPFRP